jgi:hypothetical protein
MNESELKDRFKKFAIDVFMLTKLFPRESACFNIENQQS